MTVASAANSTYKIVTILEVAANSNLAGTITLGCPFAPIKGIDSPGCEIIAGARLGVYDVVAHTAGRAVGHARVGAGTNVGQAQWRVGYVALGAGGAILVDVGGRDKLRRGAAWRGRGIGMVRGGSCIVAGGGAGARVAVREAQWRLAARRIVLHGALLLGLRLLGEAVLRRHRGVHAGQLRSVVGRHWMRPRCHASRLQDVGDGGGVDTGAGTRCGETLRQRRRWRQCVVKLDLGRIIAKRRSRHLRAYGHVQLVVGAVVAPHGGRWSR